MTFENPEAPAPEEKQNYGSDMPGLREAAKEMAPPESEVTQVLASDDAGDDLTVKQASKELTKYQRAVAAEKEAVRVAMGEGVPEPAPEEKLEARVRELESSRSSSDADANANAHYEQGRQQLQAAAQAQHQVETYRQQLIQHFQEAYPEITSIEDIQRVASYDPQRAEMAVRDLQQCEQALVTQQQAVVGQQSIAAQAIAVWGASEDAKFIKAHPELKDDAARQKAGEAAREVLRENGLSDEQIEFMWNSGQLRSVAAQNVLLLAARAHMGAKAAKQATPRVPRVLRPGQGGSMEAHGIKAATERLGRSGNLKDAAALYSLRKKG